MIGRRILWMVISFFTINLSITFGQSVAGVLVDENQQKVIGALVELLETDLATYSNGSGKFYFSSVPAGEYVLKITQENTGVYSQEISISNLDLDLGTITIESAFANIQYDESDIAIINIGDLDASEEDDLAISSVLTSGQDIFQNAASYNLFAGRFRARGYQNERSHLYMNGIQMNDLDDGRIYWNAWGGLNDVLRNRESELSLNPTTIGFGGVGGSSMIDLSPSTQRPGTRARYSFGNRSYVHRLALTYNSGERKSGWSYTFSGSRRWGNEGYIEGTFYDAWSYFGGVEKAFNDQHRMSLIIMGSPLKRGRSGGSFQEAYDLAGSVYYNPYWGLQNGEKRNARVYQSHLPTAIFNYKWKISENSKLTTAIGYQSGNYGSTGLDWYLAPDPRPDYYRKLPSWQETSSGSAAVQALYEENPDLLQIQWDKLYEVNQNRVSTINDANGQPGNNVTGRLSAYVIEQQRYDNNKLTFNSQLETVIDGGLTLTGGLQYHSETVENFKVLDDLLGGEFYIDFDEFAIRDFPGNTDVIQNDLNNPNRIIYEGDVFGYNYDINSRRAAVWGQVEYIGSKIDLHASAEISKNEFFRTGYYKVGKFPDNSLGDSEKQSFNNYGVKAGMTYKIDGRNYLYANGTYRTKSPFARFSYLSARTRDEVVDGLKSETIRGGEAGYILRFPSVKGRVSGYYTEFKDQIDNFSFYHDEERSFVNYAMNGIDSRHMGIEVGLEGKITSTLTIEFAGAIGEYIYTSRPVATIAQDNNADIIDEGRIVYQKNFYVPGTPQTAGTLGLNYRSPHFWFINANVNYFDRSYLDFNPDRRTSIAVDLVNRDEQPELWHSIIDQERLESNMTVDIFAGKSWRVDNYYIAANLSVNNILNNQKFITGGFEQYRFDYSGKDVDRFPPRYFYSYGINYSLNVSVNF